MKIIKITTFILVFSSFFSVVSQNSSCSAAADEENLEDFNNVAKCSINSSKKSPNQITVRVSGGKRRHRKKRVIKKTIRAALKRKISAEEMKKAFIFGATTTVPLFKYCDGKSNSKQIDCFNRQMIKHIQKHFNYPAQALVEKLEGNIWVRFIVDRNGNLVNVKARCIDKKNREILVDEALRVVSLLPKFKPATINGNSVSIKYGFPINFSLKDE